jgi:hypothetical protein
MVYAASPHGIAEALGTRDVFITFTVYDISEFVKRGEQESRLALPENTNGVYYDR